MYLEDLCCECINKKLSNTHLMQLQNAKTPNPHCSSFGFLIDLQFIFWIQLLHYPYHYVPPPLQAKKKILPTFPQRKTNPKLLQISKLSQDLETQVPKAFSMSKKIIIQTQFSKIEFWKLSKQRLPRACKIVN